MLSNLNSTQLFEDLMVEAKHYYYNYYITYSLCLALATVLYYKYCQNPNEILKFIFDKGTNAYTFSRLCCNDVYKRLSIIKRQEITQKISKIYLIRSNGIVQNLSEDYTAENLDTFDWNTYIENHETIADATDSRLEIVYEIAGDESNQYIAIFPYMNKPKFPIYTSEQLKKLSSNWDHWEDFFIEPIPFGMRNFDEHVSITSFLNRISTELKKYAGPAGNFYKDLTEHGLISVKSEWILDHSLEPPVPLLPPYTKVSLLDTLGDSLDL